MTGKDSCPRCHERGLKTWNELNDEEREVVKRLPSSVDYPPEQRAYHQWCTRCWYERAAEHHG